MTATDPARQTLAHMLKKVFSYEDDSTIDQVSGILLGDIEPESVEATARWVRQCFHRPMDEELEAHALNALLDGHGIEELTLDEVRYQHDIDTNGERVDDVQDIDVSFSYVNSGDSYNATLIFFDGHVYATDCGTFIENIEQQVTEHALSGGDFDDFDIDTERLPGSEVATLISQAQDKEGPEEQYVALKHEQSLGM